MEIVYFLIPTGPYIGIIFLAFLFAELLLLAKEKKGLPLELLLAAGVVIALMIYDQLDNSGAANNKPVLTAIVNFLTISMPILVFLVANQFITKITNTINKHLCILLVVISTMILWQSWAVFVICASGLDCL